MLIYLQVYSNRSLGEESFYAEKNERRRPWRTQWRAQDDESTNVFQPTQELVEMIKNDKREGGDQRHLAQCYYSRIALIVNGVHESEIYFTVQFGVN